MTETLNIRPLHDRVIVKSAEEKDLKSPGGIVIPDSAKEKPMRGVVVAVGPGKHCDKTGQLYPLEVKVGDNVLYGKYAGTELKHANQDYLVMREDDIIAIVQN